MSRDNLPAERPARLPNPPALPEVRAAPLPRPRSAPARVMAALAEIDEAMPHVFFDPRRRARKIEIAEELHGRKMQCLQEDTRRVVGEVAQDTDFALRVHQAGIDEADRELSVREAWHRQATDTAIHEAGQAGADHRHLSARRHEIFRDDVDRAYEEIESAIDKARERNKADYDKFLQELVAEHVVANKQLEADLFRRINGRLNTGFEAYEMFVSDWFAAERDIRQTYLQAIKDHPYAAEVEAQMERNLRACRENDIDGSTAAYMRWSSKTRAQFPRLCELINGQARAISNPTASE